MKRFVVICLLFCKCFTTVSQHASLFLTIKTKSGSDAFSPVFVPLPTVGDIDYSPFSLPDTINFVQYFLIKTPFTIRSKLNAGKKTNIDNELKSRSNQGSNKDVSFLKLPVLVGKDLNHNLVVYFDSNLDGLLTDEKPVFLRKLNLEKRLNSEDLHYIPIRVPLKVTSSSDNIVPVSFIQNTSDNRIYYSFAVHGEINFYDQTLEVDIMRLFKEGRFITSSITSKQRHLLKIVDSIAFFRAGRGVYQIHSVVNHFSLLVIERVLVLSNDDAEKAINFERSIFSTEEQIELEKLKGRFVFLDFWGSWCAPCIINIPEIKKAYNFFSEEEIRFIGIAQDSKRNLKKALDKYEIKWPQILVDDNDDLLSLYGVSSYPSAFLIDPDGKIQRFDLHQVNLIEYIEKQILKFKLTKVFYD